jgi:predicted metal-dependent phosphoesterase TrpH
MRIDLHTHSTASDGSLPPEDVIRVAAVAGVDVVGLTDHDTTAGWAAAAEALRPGHTLVSGAEISCRWYCPDAPPISLHLLGYLFDPEHPELAAALTRVRESRLARAERMVDLLRADGVDVSWDQVLGYAAGGTVGRPHIGRALIEAGLVDDMDAAFASQWLGRRYRMPKEDIDVFEGVRLVRAAGGVSVFAHPRAEKRGRIVTDDLIAELAEAGLHGIEVDHPDHEPAAREHLRRLATELGLLTTGSSDFHGTHKTARIGDNTTSPEVYEQIVTTATGAKPVTAS